MRLPLYAQILIALALAVLAGSLSGEQGTLFGVRLYAVYDFVGTLFLNALKMLIVPLIVSSIINGLSRVGDAQALGRLGGKTLLYYLTTTTLAVTVGLVMVNLIAPGIIDGQPSRAMFGVDAEEAAAVSDEVEAAESQDIFGVFLRMFPPNIVAAAADGQMLGLIVFSLLFGFFLARSNSPHSETLRHFWAATFEVMMQVTLLVIRFAPIGVFALVAKVVAAAGVEAVQPLAWFFFTVLAALAVHALIVIPLLLIVLGRVSPVRHFRALAPALLTAFSTASSSATLPLTLECVEKQAGVSNRTSSFVLPLGATVNMDGTALYECVAVIFLAQVFGLELTWVQQLNVVLLALLTSIGVAGIPSASLVAITIILGAVGLPLEAVGLILAVDRILDMTRTAVNVLSDTTGTVLIARSEGEKGVLQPTAASGL